MEKPDKNMVNAGIIFMFTAWIQGQMSDLILLKDNSHLIEEFVRNSTRIPYEYNKLRIKYWEKQLGDVKNKFKEIFSEQLSESEKKEVEAIYHLRNMIAHAHVSIGRNYMLYRPYGGSSRENKLISDLELEPIEDQAEPLIVKIELWRQERFEKASMLIENFEKITLKRLAEEIGVPHGRIR